MGWVPILKMMVPSAWFTRVNRTAPFCTKPLPTKLTVGLPRWADRPSITLTMIANSWQASCRTRTLPPPWSPMLETWLKSPTTSKESSSAAVTALEQPLWVLIMVTAMLRANTLWHDCQLSTTTGFIKAFAPRAWKIPTRYVLVKCDATCVGECILHRALTKLQLHDFF
jgi:hypothetical protein